MSKQLLFLAAFFLFSSCYTTRKGEEIENVFFDNCIFIDIEEQFEMEILFYFPGPKIGCGFHATISDCVGVMDSNDTIRVLTLCNSDTTFQNHQRIIVEPMKKPDFYVSPPVYLIMEGKSDKSYVPFGKLNTIYGSLQKINKE